jgi:hypothetical protein
MLSTMVTAAEFAKFTGHDIKADIEPTTKTLLPLYSACQDEHNEIYITCIDPPGSKIKDCKVTILPGRIQYQDPCSIKFRRRSTEFLLCHYTEENLLV